MTEAGEQFIKDLITRVCRSLPLNSSIHIRREQKLKPGRKAEWLEALRSDRYVQATRKLRTQDGFCCLGVQCDLSQLRSWDPEDQIFRFGTESAEPPFEVVEWAYEEQPDLALRADPVIAVYFIDAYGRKRHDRYVTLVTLATLNDAGATFEEIARVIEEVL